MDYKDLLRQYPELGDTFAEIENRLLFLEGSLPYYKEGETNPVYQDMEFTKRQWDMVKQLNAQVLHLESKLNEHIDISKRKRKGRYLNE